VASSGRAADDIHDEITEARRTSGCASASFTPAFNFCTIADAARAGAAVHAPPLESLV
jgi:hypothetical protein